MELATDDPSNADQGDISSYLEGTMSSDPGQGNEPDSITPQGQAQPVVPGTEGAPLSPKNDPSRMEYWQSQADTYKRQAQELAPYAPLIQFLNQNPAAVQAVENVLRAPGTTPQTEAAPATKPNFAQPIRPPKPDQFDAVAAYNDPASESFKYARALDTWRDDMTEFMAKKQEYQERQQLRAIEIRNQEMAQQQQAQQLSQMLQSQYKFQPQEALDFMQVMGRDENVTMDALVKLYRIIRSPQAPQPNQPTAFRRTMGPTSPALVAGASEPALDGEDEFNLSMGKYKSRTK